MEPQHITEWLTQLLGDNVIQMKYIPIITQRQDLWTQVFTPKYIDPKNNYEALEIVGDGVAAYFFPAYVIKKFPHLNNSERVKIIARLKINYASRKSFATIAESLGFWQFIKKPTELPNPTAKEVLLEDTFEAFLGAINTAIDDHLKIPFLGVAIACSFLAHIFDKKEINLDYNALFDAKTRLKELMDIKKNELGELKYINTANVTQVFIGNKLMGEAKGFIKKDREKEAAANALDLLKKEGYDREHKPIDQFKVNPLASEDMLTDLLYNSSVSGGTTVGVETFDEGENIIGSGEGLAQALHRAGVPHEIKKVSAIDIAGGDYKTKLKEYMDTKGKAYELCYKHDFNKGIVTLYLGENPITSYKGANKKIREQIVAKKVYNLMVKD